MYWSLHPLNNCNFILWKKFTFWKILMQKQFSVLRNFCHEKLLKRIHLGIVLINNLKAFLFQENLKKILIPRVWRNRGNIMFLMKCMFCLFYALWNFINQKQWKVSLILLSFEQEIVRLEFKVWGFLGKFFFGTWMFTFYTSIRK